MAGDRWTLLIVRELVPGPRRFTDLIEGLPGISRKLLTERLRDLEREGVIARRQLPPPAARQVYELTDDGRDLADAMRPLIGWGLRRLGERRPSESFNARSVAVGMAGVADREATARVSETYQYVVGDSAFHFSVDDGSVEVHDGLGREPAVVVTTDEQTWADIAAGDITTSSAIAAGRLTVAGDRHAKKRLRSLLSRTSIFGNPHAAGSGSARRG